MDEVLLLPDFRTEKKSWCLLGIWLQWILENRMKFYSDDEHYLVCVQSTYFFVDADKVETIL